MPYNSECAEACALDAVACRYSVDLLLHLVTGQDFAHHRGEFEAFTAAIQTGSQSPIPLREIVGTMLATFALEESRCSGRPVTVKELLGHATINTTMRYAHSNHEAKARAVAKLPTCDTPVTVVPRKAKKAKTAL